MDSFKYWYLIREVFDDVATEDSEYKVVRVDDDFEVRFKIGKDDYRVMMEKRNPEKQNIILNKAYDSGPSKYYRTYEIMFEGPSGLGTTDKRQQFKVYKKLLLSVKRLIEHVKPEVLKFYGSTPGMDLIYQDFYTKFLTDAPGKPDYFIFYPIGSKQFLSKTAYNELTPEDQQIILDKEQKRAEYLDGIKKRRSNFHDKRRLMSKLEGALFRTTQWGDVEISLITKADVDSAKVLRIYPERDRPYAYDPGVRNLYYEDLPITNDINDLKNHVARDLHTKPIGLSQLTRREMQKLGEAALKLKPDQIAPGVRNMITKFQTVQYREKPQGKNLPPQPPVRGSRVNTRPITAGNAWTGYTADQLRAGDFRGHDDI